VPPVKNERLETLPSILLVKGRRTQGAAVTGRRGKEKDSGGGSLHGLPTETSTHISLRGDRSQGQGDQRDKGQVFSGEVTLKYAGEVEEWGVSHPGRNRPWSGRNRREPSANPGKKNGF